MAHTYSRNMSLKITTEELKSQSVFDYILLMFYNLILLCPQKHFHELVKGKAILETGLDKLRGFQEVEAPRFRDNRHMRAMRLSSLQRPPTPLRNYS